MTTPYNPRTPINELHDMMPDQGELQRLLKKSISEWDSAVQTAGWKGAKR